MAQKSENEKLMQDLNILDEPYEFEYKEQKVKFWKLPVRSYFKLGKFLGRIEEFAIFENGKYKSFRFDKFIEEGREALALIADSLRVSIEKLESLPAEFLVWSARILFTEVIEADFIVQEVKSIKEKLSPLFPKSSEKSQETKDGQSDTSLN